jgi:hypothetical protein
MSEIVTFWIYNINDTKAIESVLNLDLNKYANLNKINTISNQEIKTNTVQRRKLKETQETPYQNKKLKQTTVH